MASSDPTSLRLLNASGIVNAGCLSLIKDLGWGPTAVEGKRCASGYRLVNAHHCKVTSESQHEFIVYEFAKEYKNKLAVRSDRYADTGRDSSSPSSSLPHSFTSYPSDLGSTSYPSGLSSGQYFAKDTIELLDRLPHFRKALKTIAFKGDSSLRPTLWDVIVLVHVLHDHSPYYDVFMHQCYWFADTIFGTLEMWPNDTAAHGEKGKVVERKGHASIGRCQGVRVHSREPGDIAEIWGKFKEEHRVLDQEMEKYEQGRAEKRELDKTKARLESEVERAKREGAERERGLRKQLEETAQLHKEQKRTKKEELDMVKFELQQNDLQLEAVKPIKPDGVVH